MRRLLFGTAALTALSLGAQTPPNAVTATFTYQAADFGPLRLYAANVCNVSPVNLTVQAYRDVWPEAKRQNLEIQTPTAIREVERQLEGSNWPKWVMWGVAGGCAITSAVTNGGAVALDPTKRMGKFVAYGTSACAIALPILAERFTGRPGGEQTNAPEGEMLQSIFVLASGDCKQGLVYARPALWLKVAP